MLGSIDSIRPSCGDGDKIIGSYRLLYAICAAQRAAISEIAAGAIVLNR
jgi:hypothetical protein